MDASKPASQHNSPAATVFQEILGQISAALEMAEANSQPLELEPYRGQLFQLFVMAEATGFIKEGARFDLTCDGIARELAVRWKLGRDANGETASPQSLPPDQLKKLKLVWSFMRLWNEWTYAWQRWPEFHDTARSVKR